MQAATRPAVSASVSGVSTTKGYSTRQSVASVTCETRDRPSYLMLSLAVTRRSARVARRRSSATSSKRCAKSSTARVAAVEQLTHRIVARRTGLGPAARLHFAQPVVQRFDQRGTPARVVQQVVLQVGVALHDPDVAQHLVEHACRAPGLALVAQPVQSIPDLLAEQADDDLAIGERGVVVRNLAQAGGGVGRGRRVRNTGRDSRRRNRRKRCVHGRRWMLPQCSISTLRRP